MWRKFKVFYNEYESVIHVLTILFAMLFTALIIAILECSDYKHKYLEAKNDYEYMYDLHKECNIRKQFLETDIQYYMDYYEEHNK